MLTNFNRKKTAQTSTHLHSTNSEVSVQVPLRDTAYRCKGFSTKLPEHFTSYLWIITILRECWCERFIYFFFCFTFITVLDMQRLQKYARDGPSDTYPLAKWRILNRLHDRNETMYYKVCNFTTHTFVCNLISIDHVCSHHLIRTIWTVYGTLYDYTCSLLTSFLL